jgi:hypothetical protein
MPPLFFDREASLTAHETWQANCGPHAIAAACGLNIEAVRGSIPNFGTMPWTTPTRLKAALDHLRQGFTEIRGIRKQEVPARGLARLQWEGRWLNAGVPKVVAYGYTHWVASWDNYVFDTGSSKFGWIPLSEWKADTDTYATTEFEGWHVTHHYLITGSAT